MNFYETQHFFVSAPPLEQWMRGILRPEEARGGGSLSFDDWAVKMLQRVATVGLGIVILKRSSINIGAYPCVYSTKHGVYS